MTTMATMMRSSRPALQAEEEEATAAKDGRVMIGLVGHPNVGKSSMVNYILGRKAVSVKATPGHTKTLQTLILDDDTCLCDSPGLVFPRVDIGLAEQIIGGLVPLPIVREPYSAVRWLAELKERTGTRWSAMAADTSMSHQDKALAHALAATVDKALKIPAVAEFDPEILELTGAEDVLNETFAVVPDVHAPPVRQSARFRAQRRRPRRARRGPDGPRAGPRRPLTLRRAAPRG
jgi:hypothetical protein